jgi:hypothetical protein
MEVSLSEYTSAVRVNFDWLGSTGFSFVKAIEEASGTRDEVFTAVYSSNEMKITIAFSRVEKSINILIRFNSIQVDRRIRWVYFEPYLEYISTGTILPIVPQVYHGMKPSQILSVMKSRDRLFAEQSFDEVLHALSSRFQQVASQIFSVNTENLTQFHVWYSRTGCP